MKRLAIITSGGDCPGLNPCIRAAVRTALVNGLEVFGVERGWRGLLERNLVPLDDRSVAGIVNRGGTILRTSRCPEFHQEESRKLAACHLEEWGIDGLIVLGGDGSLRGAWELSRITDLPIAGIPKTIDNDVGGTEYALGFDTAVNTAVEAIDKIRDTATSHDRLFIVEVMGRHRGFLALEVGLASGAESVLLPETATDIAALGRLLEAGRKAGKQSSIFVTAEGDEAGSAYQIAEKIREHARYEARVSVLGYIQRGGAPTALDRVIGGLFGKLAVDQLLEGRRDFLVARRGDRITPVDLELAWSEKRPLDPERLALLKIVAS